MLLVIVAVTGTLPLVGLILHVPVIGAVVVIVPQLVVLLFPFVSFIVSVGLYVPLLLYVCVTFCVVVLVVPSLKFHVYVYVPVPPVAVLVNCVFSGVVPLVGFTLHVAVNGL